MPCTTCSNGCKTNGMQDVYLSLVQEAMLIQGDGFCFEEDAIRDSNGELLGYSKLYRSAGTSVYWERPMYPNIIYRNPNTGIKYILGRVNGDDAWVIWEGNTYELTTTTKYMTDTFQGGYYSSTIANSLGVCSFRGVNIISDDTFLPAYYNVRDQQIINRIIYGTTVYMPSDSPLGDVKIVKINYLWSSGCQYQITDATRYVESAYAKINNLQINNYQPVINDLILSKEMIWMKKLLYNEMERRNNQDIYYWENDAVNQVPNSPLDIKNSNVITDGMRGAYYYKSVEKWEPGETARSEGTLQVDTPTIAINSRYATLFDWKEPPYVWYKYSIKELVEGIGATNTTSKNYITVFDFNTISNIYGSTGVVVYITTNNAIPSINNFIGTIHFVKTGGSPLDNPTEFICTSSGQTAVLNFPTYKSKKIYFQVEVGEAKCGIRSQYICSEPFTLATDDLAIRCSYSPDTGFVGNYQIEAESVAESYTKGDFIERVTDNTENAYPINGIYDNAWYTRIYNGIVDTKSYYQWYRYKSDGLSGTWRPYKPKHVYFKVTPDLKQVPTGNQIKIFGTFKDINIPTDMSARATIEDDGINITYTDPNIGSYINANKSRLNRCYNVHFRDSSGDWENRGTYIFIDGDWKPITDYNITESLNPVQSMYDIVATYNEEKDKTGKYVNNTFTNLNELFIINLINNKQKVNFAPDICCEYIVRGEKNTLGYFTYTLAKCTAPTNISNMSDIYGTNNGLIPYQDGYLLYQGISVDSVYYTEQDWILSAQLFNYPTVIQGNGYTYTSSNQQEWNTLGTNTLTGKYLNWYALNNMPATPNGNAVLLYQGMSGNLQLIDIVKSDDFNAYQEGYNNNYYYSYIGQQTYNIYDIVSSGELQNILYCDAKYAMGERGNINLNNGVGRLILKQTLYAMEQNLRKLGRTVPSADLQVLTDKEKMRIYLTEITKLYNDDFQNT